jgi:hypothetical protein
MKYIQLILKSITNNQLKLTKITVNIKQLYNIIAIIKNLE